MKEVTSELEAMELGWEHVAPTSGETLPMQMQQQKSLESFGETADSVLGHR